VRLAGHKACVIPNGVDLEAIDRAVADGAGGVPPCLPAEGRLVGAACRFVHQKNLERLVEAFGLLAVELRDIRLALVGAGPLLPRLKALAADLGCADRVLFPGARTRADVHRFMRAVDAYAVPSLWEGYCNA